MDGVNNTRNLTFLEMLEDKTLSLLFRDFLRDQYMVENLNYWVEIEEYKIMSNDVLIQEQAKLLYKKYIIQGGKMELNIDDDMRKDIMRAINNKVATLSTFNETQKFVLSLLEHDCYPKFLRSKTYKHYIETNGIIIPPNRPNDEPSAKKLLAPLMKLVFGKTKDTHNEKNKNTNKEILIEITERTQRSDSVIKLENWQNRQHKRSNSQNNNNLTADLIIQSNTTSPAISPRELKTIHGSNSGTVVEILHNIRQCSPPPLPKPPKSKRNKEKSTLNKIESEQPPSSVSAWRSARPRRNSG